MVLRSVAVLLLLLGTQLLGSAAAAPSSEDPVTTGNPVTGSRSSATARKRTAAKIKKRTPRTRKRSKARTRKSSRVKKAKKGAAAPPEPIATDGEALAADPDVKPEELLPASETSTELAPRAARPVASEPGMAPGASVVAPTRTSDTFMTEPTTATTTTRAMTRATPLADSAPHARGGPSAHASLETSGYLDTDHVSVVSPTTSVGLTDEVNGWSVNGHYLVDVVSAASVDIVSTASPHWTEVRHAGGANGSATFDPITVGASAVISREPDYLSITGGTTLSVDLLDKNLTPYLAFSREEDSVGRTDLPHEYWHSKHVTNLQLGLTVVLSRSTIGSVQWDGSFERGYLAKPYRYVPLFAPGQAAAIPAGASVDDVNRLRLSLRPAEQVPSARDRHALSFHLAHRGDATTLRLDERLYADDWGLMAATSELRYIIDLGRSLELWPHLRHHIQSAVRFWRRAYEAIPGPGGDLGVPVFRTGNRELGALQTIVMGGGARLKLAEPPGNQWDLVFEFDAGRTTFGDALYISERFMGYSTLAVEASF